MLMPYTMKVTSPVQRIWNGLFTSDHFGLENGEHEADE